VLVDGGLKIGFIATDFEGILFFFGNYNSRRKNRQAIGTPKSSSATAEKWQSANRGLE
jgi:hypothetical protein